MFNGSEEKLCPYQCQMPIRGLLKKDSGRKLIKTGLFGMELIVGIGSLRRFVLDTDNSRPTTEYRCTELTNGRMSNW